MQIQMKKIRSILKTYLSIPAAVLYGAALLSLALFAASLLSVRFSDFFCEKIAGGVRMLLAKITGIFPFSLAETVILSLPLILFAIIFYVVRMTKRGEDIRVRRFFVSAFALLSAFFTLFVFTYGTGYHGSTLDQKLGIEKKKVSAAQLAAVAELLTERVNACSEEVDYIYNSFSVMPYGFSELNDRLNDAYIAAAEEYDFIFAYSSRLKPVMISEGMSYTHILGMYTYYTGEANINVNFPDYITPYTCAHEMSHQRGISREDEANFMAYLVCRSSEDPYIRYCGELNLLEYVYNALYSADKSAYRAVYQKLVPEVQAELRAYSEFFKKYEENKAASVTGTLNDHFLKANGQSAGEKSYGLVVDLAVAYLLPET